MPKGDRKRKKMMSRYELKNIKHYHGLSDDSNAFTADLWIDGKEFAHAKDDGNGGSIHFTLLNGNTWDDFKQHNEWAKENIPPLPSEFSKKGLKLDLDLICGMIVVRDMYKTELQEKMWSHIVTLSKDGCFSYRLGTHTKGQIIKAIKQQRPDEEILNTKNIEVATDKYKAYMEA